ncbi:hypothetical protein NLJ89_g3942 [Agrocybe chaxingu]|uniref:NAD(P)-binding protein n=1 Tax=Agrocybe chaxingu TaxID=84603 RepID=A0A9W8K3T2_9AGAR|nr:hypothetical protein NLJ89_g3942 [Agrocybe chaxingu]
MLSEQQIQRSLTLRLHHQSPFSLVGRRALGRAWRKAFARQTKGNSSIVIVGRNQSAADRILASLPPSDAGVTVAREFVQCDVTLMKNVQDATRNILDKFPKINYLVVSTGIMTTAGRTETTEGVDRKLAVHYYARWKFIHDLLPPVQAAKDAGEHASVMTVLAPGYGGEIDLNDLALKNTYSLSKVALVASTYNDLMCESFAEKASTIPFIHAHPGFVRTPLFANSPSLLFRVIAPVGMALLRPWTVSGDDCAEYMWNAIYSTAKTPGAWRTGFHGEDLAKKRYYGDEEQRKKLWEHTSEVIEGALKS